jgi:hypothetical protein
LYGYAPNIISESVADDLTVTAFYFKQGTIQALMVSATVCAVNNKLSKILTDKLAEELSIPAQNCMVCSTHTHSGPNLSGSPGWGDVDMDYFEKIFLSGILTAAKQAKANLKPVKMGIASGNSYIGINRRELTADNTVILGQNPWGCFNPRMVVISFIDDSGKNIANMIHYGLHGTSAGMNHEITRDWSGVMIDTLEKQTGGITAFFNGPEGDVGPRISNGKTIGSHDMHYVYELGAIAAQDAVRIQKQIYAYENVELRVSERKLQIPLKKRIPLEEAIALQEKYKGQTRNIAGRYNYQSQRLIRSYEEGYVDQENTEFSRTVIALGSTVFASFICELFSEIGLRIDQYFDRAMVLSLINTNGSEGYFVTQDAISRGGYEVNSANFWNLQARVDNADYFLFKGTVAHVEELLNI